MKTIAIVTGASSGIGKEFVRQLDGQYYGLLDEIWVVARSYEKLEALENMTYSKLRIFPVDLINEEELSDFVSALEHENPQVKFLINAAGWGSFEDFKEDSLDRNMSMVDLNVRALVEMTYQVLPYMYKNSHIINMGSVAAFMPLAGASIYAASKSFVLTFSRALHHELKDVGISVTTVCPPGVHTNFFKRAGNKSGVYNTIARLGIIEPFDVVNLALEDARMQKDISLPSFAAKFLYVASRLTPTDLSFAIQEWMARPLEDDELKEQAVKDFNGTVTKSELN
ncbi:MAG: SDR family NAD(P)-dependent oxidoreductase [Coriobacteriia bacterium]|nr:SDR family NAD(P)-dependent oxidoreductase [Coriobacteriia bacterium]